jgi:hypothetical protein
MAVSTLAQVPANLLWAFKGGNSAARRTTGIVGGVALDHYSARMAKAEYRTQLEVMRPRPS